MQNQHDNENTYDTKADYISEKLFQLDLGKMSFLSELMEVQGP